MESRIANLNYKIAFRTISIGTVFESNAIALPDDQPALLMRTCELVDDGSVCNAIYLTSNRAGLTAYISCETRVKRRSDVYISDAPKSES